MTKKFDATAVPVEAFAEWQACDERPLSEHFLKGWLLATKAVLKAAGITLSELTSRADQKSVFGIIKEAARSKVKMGANTFERYCKIARYCVIYGCPWEAAQALAEQDHDDHWLKYLGYQVDYIQKNMDLLDGDSAVQDLMMDFYGKALALVKKAKAKAKTTNANVAAA